MYNLPDLRPLLVFAIIGLVASAVLMDDNLIPLCRSCADGCETEEFDA